MRKGWKIEMLMMTKKMKWDEYQDDEAKAYLLLLMEQVYEIGEPADRIVIDNGKPKHRICPLLKHSITMN